MRTGDEISYLRLLYAFFRRCRKGATKEEGLDWLSLCNFELPYNKFYLVREAADWCHELDFERCQRMNVKGRRVLGWHNHKMFFIPPQDRDMFHQTVKDLWVECKGSRALGISTPVVFA